MTAVAVLERLRDEINAGRFEIVEELSENERFRESVHRMVAAFPDVHLESGWILGEGTKAVTWTTARGTHRGEWRGIPPTGNPVEYSGVLAIEVDPADRIVDFWVVNDWLSLALQLGAQLIPPSA